jgi:hypothetical protein
MRCPGHLRVHTWLYWRRLYYSDLRANMRERGIVLSSRHLLVRLRMVRQQLHHSGLRADLRKRRQLHFSQCMLVP